MPRLLDLAALARRLHMLDQRCGGAKDPQAPGALLLGCSVDTGGDVVVDGLAVGVDGSVWILVSCGRDGVEMGKEGLTRI